MNLIKIIIISYIAGIFLASLLLAITGFDFLKLTITDLGFFNNNILIHNIFAFITFFICPIVVFLDIVFHTQYKKRSYFGLFIPFLSIFYFITFLPIIEWVCFWLLNIWILIKIKKN